MCAPFFVFEPSIVAALPGVDVIWRGRKVVHGLEKGCNIHGPYFFLPLTKWQMKICSLFGGISWCIRVGDVPL
jgi:hypothetical protein